MRVFVAFVGSHEDRQAVGVFSSLEKAEAYLQTDEGWQTDRAEVEFARGTRKARVDKGLCPPEMYPNLIGPLRMYPNLIGPLRPDFDVLGFELQ
jgi:hypothetical protein